MTFWCHSTLSRSSRTYESAKEYLNLIKVCADQTGFVFNQTFYQQRLGLAMGNPISPFLAEIFMSFFECSLLKEHAHVFKVCFRYVDDVFCILKKSDVTKALTISDSRGDSIKFTIEQEKDGKLPFLDLLIQRAGETLEFDIYRKPTSTTNYIKRSSFDPWSHKLAAFRSMIFRLLNVFLSTAKFKLELQNIVESGVKNGFKSETILNIFSKMRRKIKNATNLQKIKNISVFRKFNFHPVVHHKFERIFKNMISPWLLMTNLMWENVLVKT